jgi:hypothetical protein
MRPDGLQDFALDSVRCRRREGKTYTHGCPSGAAAASVEAEWQVEV